MSDYLSVHKNKSLSKIIFASTFDVKLWQEWKYQDGFCVMCKANQEDMDHFMNCTWYETKN